MSVSADKKKEYDALAINNFRQYLRIPSVHPDINYDECVTFLQDQAKGLGLPIKIYYPKPNKPVVVISWIGTEPNIPTILLNSHMDVVPVFEEKWTHKPFAADMDASGKIFARGSQDMKCVGIQYLEAIRRLKNSGIRLRRTLQCSFVPEEEIGGLEGMKAFVEGKDFSQLNVGFSLDEGMASADGDFLLFYGERCTWHITFHCPGQPGHGSLLHENTAAEKVRIFLDRIFDMREEEKAKLKNNPNFTIGDVMTLNLTVLDGGVQANVLPPEFRVTLDCRIPVTYNVTELRATFDKWCKEAGEGIWVDEDQFEPMIAPTKLDDTNPYWGAFKKAATDMGIKLTPRIFPGGTDSRFLRGIGIPAFGFSPIINTPILLHDHDEYLEAHVFLKGIEYYQQLISAIANVEDKTG